MSSLLSFFFFFTFSLFKSVYLPPYNPQLQPYISARVQEVVSTTLDGNAAPGPALMPVIELDSDASLYPDPQERAHVTLTRAQRLKRQMERTASETLPLGKRAVSARDSGVMGFYYSFVHPEIVEAPLDNLRRTRGAKAVSDVAVKMEEEVKKEEAASEQLEPQFPRVVFPEFVGNNHLPEPLFKAATQLLAGEDEVNYETLALKDLPEEKFLTPDQRTPDLNVDAIRTITRAKGLSIFPSFFLSFLNSSQ